MTPNPCPVFALALEYASIERRANLADAQDDGEQYSALMDALDHIRKRASWQSPKCDEGAKFLCELVELYAEFVYGELDDTENRDTDFEAIKRISAELRSYFGRAAYAVVA